jgi:hypothetical protein
MNYASKVILEDYVNHVIYIIQGTKATLQLHLFINVGNVKISHIISSY